jgi:hypothetical protein
VLIESRKVDLNSHLSKQTLNTSLFKLTFDPVRYRAPGEQTDAIVGERITVEVFSQY